MHFQFFFYVAVARLARNYQISSGLPLKTIRCTSVGSIMKMAYRCPQSKVWLSMVWSLSTHSLTRQYAQLREQLCWQGLMHHVSELNIIDAPNLYQCQTEARCTPGICKGSDTTRRTTVRPIITSLLLKAGMNLRLMPLGAIGSQASLFSTFKIPHWHTKVVCISPKRKWNEIPPQPIQIL